MIVRPISLLILIILAIGCSSANNVGAFEDDAFYHVRGHYRVRYEGAGAERRALLPTNDWTLENFEMDVGGGPARVSRSSRFWTEYALDVGSSRPHRVRAELFDLRFVHRRDGTVLWARTLPLSHTSEETSLEVLARDYVERAASGSAMTVDFSPTPAAHARRFGPRILHEGRAEIDGQPAYFIIFEHVDLDRREAEPDSRGEIFTLVFTRPGPTRWLAGVHVGSEWPMVLVFGYASRPEHHASHRATLESLLGRVDVRTVDPHR
jgi:hypothetical protein